MKKSVSKGKKMVIKGKLSGGEGKLPEGLEVHVYDESGVLVGSSKVGRDGVLEMKCKSAGARLVVMREGHILHKCDLKELGRLDIDLGDLKLPWVDLPGGEGSVHVMGRVSLASIPGGDDAGAEGYTVKVRALVRAIQFGPGGGFREVIDASWWFVDETDSKGRFSVWIGQGMIPVSPINTFIAWEIQVGNAYGNVVAEGYVKGHELVFADTVTLSPDTQFDAPFDPFHLCFPYKPHHGKMVNIDLGWRAEISHIGSVPVDDVGSDGLATLNGISGRPFMNGVEIEGVAFGERMEKWALLHAPGNVSIDDTRLDLVDPDLLDPAQADPNTVYPGPFKVIAVGTGGIVGSAFVDWKTHEDAHVPQVEGLRSVILMVFDKVGEEVHREVHPVFLRFSTVPEPVISAPAPNETIAQRGIVKIVGTALDEYFHRFNVKWERIDDGLIVDLPPSKLVDPGNAIPGQPDPMTPVQDDLLRLWDISNANEFPRGEYVLMCEVISKAIMNSGKATQYERSGIRVFVK